MTYQSHPTSTSSPSRSWSYVNHSPPEVTTRPSEETLDRYHPVGPPLKHRLYPRRWTVHRLDSCSPRKTRSHRSRRFALALWCGLTVPTITCPEFSNGPCTARTGFGRRSRHGEWSSASWTHTSIKSATGRLPHTPCPRRLRLVWSRNVTTAVSRTNNRRNRLNVK